MKIIICPDCKRNLGTEGSDAAGLVIKEHKMFGNCHPISTDSSEPEK